jgi:signal transduction histidine kinase
MALCISKFMASRLSRPIKDITKKAKRLANGDYIADYDGGGIAEIDELAETLNFSAEGLSRVEELRRELMANVSHDLKTPLTMIRSYAEMIRDLSGDNPEKRNAHLQVIIDESMRMTQLVSDMASISAMNTNKVVLEKEVFDICTVTASILASYEVLQEKEGYNFVYNHPKECLVYADKKRIEQVISNLTGNAIKYCGDDKTVIVNIKRVGQKCLVEVTDYGPGIKPEELPHIWDRYYKTSTNYVRPTSGSGLGLSIVKEMLTLHRVNYGADSKVGKGSTFWFELDIAKKQLPQRTKQPSADAQKDASSGQPENTSL